ncbi:MAG: hypothetical protein WC178_05700 [Candidatus Paceibacterota bacterium]
MLFFENRDYSEQELDSLKEEAIEHFKIGIKRINNGEDPRQVGELEWAIKEFKNYQEASNISNKEMFDILEKNKISLSDPNVYSAVEKNFVVEFSKALGICEWYKEVMGLDMSTYILNGIKDRFVKDLKWTSYYKEMIDIGGFSGEFLLSSEVQEVAKQKFLDIVKNGNIEEISEFIQLFKLENLDFTKETAEEKFVELVKENKFDEALRIKELFKLDNSKELLKDFKEFYDKL